MSNHKYVGMDVHLATVVLAVLDTRGKCVCESVIETQGGTILEFIERALAGPSTWSLKRGRESAWLYDLLGPRVAEVVVCNTRKQGKVAGENHADRADARKLANRLRLGEVKAVYQGERGLRTLKELVHGYDSLVRDQTPVMNRIKAVYRSRGIACRGRGVYQVRGREVWLGELSEPGLQTASRVAGQDLREVALEQRRQAVADASPIPEGGGGARRATGGSAS